MDLFIKSLITIGVGYIAFNQYKLAKDRFKLDLFDRRMEIFSELEKTMLAIVRCSELNDVLDVQSEHSRLIRKAVFLFDNDSRSEPLWSYRGSAVENSL